MTNHKVPTLAFPKERRGEVQKEDKYKAAGAITQPGGLHAHIWRFLSSLDTSYLTKQVYQKGLERFEHWIRENNITSPTREDILRYKEYLVTEGLAPLSVSCYLVALRRFFSYLEGIKAYPDVAKGIKGMKRPRGFLKDTLTKTQIHRLLSGIEGKEKTDLRDYAMINLMVRTGLRTIEVTRADIKDIGTESNETVLRVWGKGRSEKDDFVILTHESYDPLMDYLKTRKHSSDDEPLFISHSNRSVNGRLTTRSIRRLVKWRMALVGLATSKLTAHSLRHTSATLALQNGADIVSVKDMLRHTNINTTMIYVHNLNRIEKGAEKFISF